MCTNFAVGENKISCKVCIFVFFTKNAPTEGDVLLYLQSSAASLAQPSCRSEWGADDEPCHKKLSFELWTYMKAEGSAENPDAQYVRASCMHTMNVGLVELITPEVSELLGTTLVLSLIHI